MPVVLHHRRGRLALFGALTLLLSASACSSGSDAKPSPAARAAPTSASAATSGAADKAGPAFSPVVATSELVVGTNRFALGIIDDKTRQPLPDAQVHFRFFTLVGTQGTPRFERDAQFIAPARDAGVQQVVNHRHVDGANHQHANIAADVGVYVAQVQFDQPGKWGVQAAFRTTDGREASLNAAFDVLAQPLTPAVGQPAPRSRNLTARDVQDLTQIDSAVAPVAALHQTTVADALAAGRPVLVAFITPGYCQTQFCGPAYDLVAKLIPMYGEKAALIHIEVYKDPVKRVPADAFTEWKLTTEPLIYVIDRVGVITARFEGPVGLAELDAALAQVTS